MMLDFIIIRLGTLDFALFGAVSIDYVINVLSMNQVSFL